MPGCPSEWEKRNYPRFDLREMEASLRLACDWLISPSMCPDKEIAAEQNPSGYRYEDWRGAAREYYAGEKRWNVFGPVWHTGQMVKALVLAYRFLHDDALLQAARKGASLFYAPGLKIRIRRG